MMRTCGIIALLAGALALPALALAGDQLAFEDIDTNADGQVSKIEAKKVEGLDFVKADTNEDGWLSRVEYALAMELEDPS